ncbi:MAG TPA: esterase-like activity of phytase family protein [Paracoccus sp. (in: a-proteobacteria)]|nr:esterase-like activity of phytase family protein [Paracoccus sp. (in: a-proteobacteria)]
MPDPRRALIAGLAGLAVLAGGLAAVQAATVDYLGTFVWREVDPDFGGYSGLEMSDDGRSYTALSDRGTIRWGSIDRDTQGRIRDVTTAGTARLKDSRGKMVQPGYLGDSEGLAIDAQGRIFVSFEGLDRIARYDDPDDPAIRIPGAVWFSSLHRNRGLEALAVTPAGDLLTIPETWSGDSFPLWRLRDGEWSHPFSIPREGRWLAVGADVGPDGRLYLLERDFKGPLGFASRVRRFTMTEDALGEPETLVESRFLQFDNLEGIAVWQDGQGIRLTMVSDDNFFFLQKTELVEYRIRD